MYWNRAVFVLAAAIVACSSGGGDTNVAASQVQVKGTVADCVYAGESCGSPVPSAAQREGRILVLAVDADANVHQASTLATGAFSLPVPKGKSYVIMFRDSAGRFLGTLIVNDPPAGPAAAVAASTSLLAAADLDLGTIEIEPGSGTATSTNAAALTAAAQSSTIAGPGDVVYGASSRSMVLSLYNPPTVPGTVVVKTSSCGPDVSGCYEVAKVTSEFVASPLYRDVLVTWRYGVGGCDTGTCQANLFDKQWKYLTATSECHWKSEFYDRDMNWVVNQPVYPDGCFPDTVELGSGFVVATAPRRVWASARAAYDAVTFPDLDPARSFPAVIVWLLKESENRPPEYMWVAKGFGEVLAGMADPESSSTVTPPAVFPPPDVADYLAYLPTTAGDTRYESRVVCKKTPDGAGGFAVDGACPEWLADEFVNGLPTDFNPPPPR